MGDRIRIRLEFVCSASDVNIMTAIGCADVEAASEAALRSWLPKEWWDEPGRYVDLAPGAKLRITNLTRMPRRKKAAK